MARRCMARDMAVPLWLVALVLLGMPLGGCAVRETITDYTATPAAYPSPTSAHSSVAPRSTLRWVIRSPATSTLTMTPSPTATVAPIEYVVRPGDSLEEIAASFHVTVVELMASNELGHPKAIRPGDTLLVEHPGITPTPAKTPMPSPPGS